MVVFIDEIVLNGLVILNVNIFNVIVVIVCWIVVVMFNGRLFYYLMICGIFFVLELVDFRIEECIEMGIFVEEVN